MKYKGKEIEKVDGEYGVYRVVLQERGHDIGGQIGLVRYAATELQCKRAITKFLKTGKL